MPPAIGHLVELLGDLPDGDQEKLLLVGEVGVEGGPRDVRGASDLLDGDVSERSFVGEFQSARDDPLAGLPASVPGSPTGSLLPRGSRARLRRHSSDSTLPDIVSDALSDNASGEYDFDWIVIGSG